MLALLTVIVYFSIFFLIAQIKKDNSIVDMGWGPGFVLISWVLYLQTPSVSTLVLPMIISFWGIYLVSLGLGTLLLTFLSPLIMTYLLRYVSGVPLLEKHLFSFQKNPKAKAFGFFYQTNVDLSLICSMETSTPYTFFKLS